MHCGMKLILILILIFLQITTIDDPVHDDSNYVELASSLRDDDDDEYDDGDDADQVDEIDDHDHDLDLDDDDGGARQLLML